MTGLPIVAKSTAPVMRVLTASLTAVSLLATGCDGPDTAHRQSRPVVIDDLGRTINVGRPARRIISTVPAVTELITALHAADRLVARTAHDASPLLAHLPDLGRTLSPGIESILALQPDLVITGPMEGGTDLLRRLESLGTPSYVADVQQIGDIYATTERLGRLLGLPDRADSLVAALRTSLDRARHAYASQQRVTVLYLIWHDPPRTTGAGTFIDELITIAGGANVFADLRTSWPSISHEEIVRRDPDVLVIAHAGARNESPRWLQEGPVWRSLTAVRNHRVVHVDADLFNRPGPRIVDAAHTLGAALRSAAAEVQP